MNRTIDSFVAESCTPKVIGFFLCHKEITYWSPEAFKTLINLRRRIEYAVEHCGMTKKGFYTKEIFDEEELARTELSGWQDDEVNYLDEVEEEFNGDDCADSSYF